MALTGSTNESPSDDFVVVGEEIESKQKSGSVEQEKEDTEPARTELNASKLEEHNKNMKEEVQVLRTPGTAEDDDGSETKTKVGAGLLFGIPGLLIGGPLLGILAGVGAVYVASNDEGAAGDAAREAGEFAATTGSKVGEAAKEANEEHGIVDKIKNAFSTGWGKVQELDKDGKIADKAKETANEVKEKTVEFEQKHHVLENLLTGIQNGVNFLLGKVKDATSDAPCSGDTCNSES